MLNTLSSRATFYDVVGYLVPGVLTIGIVVFWGYVFADVEQVLRLIRAILRYSFISSIFLCALGYILGHLMNSFSSCLLEKWLLSCRFNKAKDWRLRLGTDDRKNRIRRNVVSEYGVDVASLTSFDIRIRMEEKMPNATITGFSFLSFYGMSRTLALLFWIAAIPVAEYLRTAYSSWWVFGGSFIVCVGLGFLLVYQYLRFVEYYYDFLGSTLLNGMNDK